MLRSPTQAPASSHHGISLEFAQELNTCDSAVHQFLTLLQGLTGDALHEFVFHVDMKLAEVKVHGFASGLDKSCSVPAWIKEAVRRHVNLFLRSRSVASESSGVSCDEVSKVSYKRRRQSPVNDAIVNMKQESSPHSVSENCPIFPGMLSSEYSKVFDGEEPPAAPALISEELYVSTRSDEGPAEESSPHESQFPADIDDDIGDASHMATSTSGGSDSIHSGDFELTRCTACAVLLPSTKELAEHDAAFHGPLDLALGSRQSSRCVCFPCKKSFASRKNLQRHMKEQHARLLTKFRCGVCESMYKRKHDLEAHLRRFHNLRSNVDIEANSQRFIVPTSVRLASACK